MTLIDVSGSLTEPLRIPVGMCMVLGEPESRLVSLRAAENQFNSGPATETGSCLGQLKACQRQGMHSLLARFYALKPLQQHSAKEKEVANSTNSRHLHWVFCIYWGSTCEASVFSEEETIEKTLPVG